MGPADFEDLPRVQADMLATAYERVAIYAEQTVVLVDTLFASGGKIENRAEAERIRDAARSDADNARTVSRRLRQLLEGNPNA